MRTSTHTPTPAPARTPADDVATERRMIKVLNRSEGADMDAQTWWSDQVLYMRDASGRESAVSDDDRAVSWDTVFWAHWAGKLDHWSFITGSR